uniref:C2H2-type domain-containing protein n=1 Tax=viral metagenome TaxID=1070528 RepID=A0A6C0AYQ2_9ZZZZ|tara:strand:- start:1013 stop:1927 length:915 start_codon:yes stop_codon:yes gene_type:complete
MSSEKAEKSSFKFFCKSCNFKCCNKQGYDRHILTSKHKILTNTSEKVTKSVFLCQCGKEYKHRQSLYNHKKKCHYIEDKNIIIKSDNNEENDQLDYKSMFIKMIKENEDIRNTLVSENKKLRSQISELIPKVGNNNNIINNKQRFNINIFLNEECKDALTMNEFIDKIKVTLDNLMITKNKGLTEGVSNIFIENMNKLSIHERPMHCTDVKRETVYIKCGDPETPYGWLKDEENKNFKEAISKISHVQQKNIDKWTKEHPDWKSNQALQEEYLTLIKNCTDDLKENKREEKVIKNVCNNVYLKS